MSQWEKYQNNGYAVFRIWLNVPAIKKSKIRHSPVGQYIEPCFEIHSLVQVSPFFNDVESASQHLVKVLLSECEHRKRTCRFVIAPVFHDVWYEVKTDEEGEDE